MPPGAAKPPPICCAICDGQPVAAASRDYEFEIDLTLLGIVVHATNDTEAAGNVHAMTPDELLEAARGTLKHRIRITRI